MKVSIIGSGAWGTTLAMIACDAGHDVLIWGRNRGVVEEINATQRNSGFLGAIDLPSNLRATDVIDEAFAFGDVLTLAIPAQSLRVNLETWRDR